MKKSITYSVQQLRWSRVHAALVPGQSLYATTSQRQTPVRPYFRMQDDLSGCCGILCVGTALSILGVIKASAFENAPSRKYGRVADIWRVLGDTYFTGMTTADLYQRLGTLDLPIKLDCVLGKSVEINREVIRWLSSGSLAIVAYEGFGRHKHHVLAVGVGGIQKGKAQIADSIFTIDSGAPEPMLAAHNGLMRRGSGLADHGSEKSRLKAHQWQYETTHCDGVETAQLIGAIRIQLKT